MNEKEKGYFRRAVALSLLFTSGAVLSRQQPKQRNNNWEAAVMPGVCENTNRQLKLKTINQKDNWRRSPWVDIWKHRDHLSFCIWRLPPTMRFEQKKPGATTSTVEDNYVTIQMISWVRKKRWICRSTRRPLPAINRSRLANAQTVTRVEDNYVFNPNDIVSENELGFVVRHGDHFHLLPFTISKRSDRDIEKMKTARRERVNYYASTWRPFPRCIRLYGMVSASYTFDDRPTSRPSTGGSHTGVASTIGTVTPSSPVRQAQPVTPPTLNIATPQAEIGHYNRQRFKIFRLHCLCPA